MQFGCLVLFLVPFMAVALGTGVVVFVRAVAGDWAQAGFVAIFAIAFGGMSSWVLGNALAGRRRAAAAERLKARHPDAPWMWRPDWSAGRIEGATGKRLRFAWFFAGLWNVIAAPAPVLAWKELTQEGNRAALAAFIFPIAGLFLIGWAVRQTVRYRKFGVSVFELGTIPGVINRVLRGTVRANADLRPSEGFQTKLLCVRRVTTGSGKNRSTSERILWQENRTVTDTRRELGRQMAIPVAFRIPSDVEPSDDSDPDNRVIWRVEVNAGVPGVDYHASFEVPVFRTAESNEPLPPDEANALDPIVDQPYRQAAGSRIAVTTTRRGTEIYFAPARNPRAAVATTLFLIVWAGATWLTVTLGAPLLFPLVFGLFGALLLYIVLDLWLGITRIRITPEVIAVTSGFVFATRTKRIRPSAVADIKVQIGMQSGQTPYYRIEIPGTDGSKVVAGRGIRDKREAEWLVGVMKEAIGE